VVVGDSCAWHADKSSTIALSISHICTGKLVRKGIPIPQVTMEN
jgi:hypothetical protein